jgi:hypothetical protein
MVEYACSIGQTVTVLDQQPSLHMPVLKSTALGSICRTGRGSNIELARLTHAH